MDLFALAVCVGLLAPAGSASDGRFRRGFPASDVHYRTLKSRVARWRGDMADTPGRKGETPRDGAQVRVLPERRWHHEGA